MKNEHDYTNEILSAVNLAMANPKKLKEWKNKFGEDCLSIVITKIVKRAMRKK